MGGNASTGVVLGEVYFLVSRPPESGKKTSSTARWENINVRSFAGGAAVVLYRIEVLKAMVVVRGGNVIGRNGKGLNTLNFKILYRQVYW